MSISFSYVLDVSDKIIGTYEGIDTVQVFTDTRKKTANGLFVPIQGERFDGHDFLANAIEAGAVAAFWQKGRMRPNDVPEEFPLLMVENPLEAMQALATKWREAINPVVVAITGSNGKTSTKDILASTLGETFETYKTQGNLNNHIGAPLTILSMPPSTEVLILEMGMNHFGEIALLSRMARPNFAVITNIGESHIEFLGSREGIAQAKLEIVDGLKPGGSLIIDGDEPLLDAVNPKMTKTCGYNKSSDYRIDHVEHLAAGYQFCVNDSVYELPMLGNHNVKNASLCVAVADLLHMNKVDIGSGLKSVQISDMRFQRVDGPSGSAVINDAYNASPTSMKAAVETVKHLPDFKRRILVLGDMYELGVNEEHLHRQVAEAIGPPITHVFTVGSRAAWIADELTKSKSQLTVQSFNSQQDLAKTIKPLLSPDCVLLLKASRGASLEKVLGLLDAKKGDYNLE